MARTTALFGGSFNPAGRHHREVAEFLARHFDEVVVVPCGPRPDKPGTNDVPPVCRAAMADMNFRGIPNVRVDLFDLEARTFTPTWSMEERFKDQGETWHVVGTDLIAGGGKGQSPIQTEWLRGPEIWRNLRFAVLKRPGVSFELEDLPPQNRFFETDIPGSSSDVRDRIFHHRSVKGLVSAQVESYIDRHELYRGIFAPPSMRLSLGELRPFVIADPQNPEAMREAPLLGKSVEDDPNLIVVVGGDGTMLRAIRSEWRRRVPFYGVNAGHLGFLLNRNSPLRHVHEYLIVEELPLLWVETAGADGQTRSELAFNDAWVERATGQTAWIRVLVNGIPRLPHLMADGALISTAAGSASYARAMGAPPMPLNTPALLLVGSNVLRPVFWKSAVLPLDSEVQFESLDPVKRPLKAFIDGVPQGEVLSLKARISSIAAVELAFDPEDHMAEKLAKIQFPP